MKLFLCLASVLICLNSSAFAESLPTGCFKGTIKDSNMSEKAAIFISPANSKGAVKVVDDSPYCSVEKPKFKIKQASGSGFHVGNHPSTCDSCDRSEVKLKRLSKNSIEYRISVSAGGCAAQMCWCNVVTRAKGILRKVKNDPTCSAN